MAAGLADMLHRKQMAIRTQDPFAEAIDQLRTGCLYPIQNQFRMNIRAQ